MTTTTILGQKIGTTGYGLMGLTWRPTPAPQEQAFKAMKASLSAGCNFWNAGEFYGTREYNSLHLMAAYFTKYPEDADKVVLSIKGGIRFPEMKPDGSTAGVKRSIDYCRQVLNGTKKIDIFECARVDKSVPLEETMHALEAHVKAGDIGGISLSEVGAETIRKAASMTKIVAVEVELSLWATDIFSNGVAKACADLNIPVVAYSPIGRGILTGEIKTPNDFPEGDFRKHLPRFQPGAFETNLKLVTELQHVAKAKGCTPAQLAISWVKQQSRRSGNPEIIPIPGATTESRVLENGKDFPLTEEELSHIEDLLSKFEVVGGRYGGPQAALMEG